jgi:hypothetical protein
MTADDAGVVLLLIYVGLLIAVCSQATRAQKAEEDNNFLRASKRVLEEQLAREASRRTADERHMARAHTAGPHCPVQSCPMQMPHVHSAEYLRRARQR